MAIELRWSGSKNIIRPFKSITNPQFKSDPAHVFNVWDLVEMWLSPGGKGKNEKALRYWKQAKSFAEANKSIDILSKPLTSYYSTLNAVKAMLESKSVKMNTLYHGIKGDSIGQKRILSNEIINIKSRGVLGDLCRFYGDTNLFDQDIAIEKLLYNIPFIHRAYNLSRKATELFIPLNNVSFYSCSNKKIWVAGQVSSSWENKNINKILPPGYEYFKYQDETNPSIQETWVRRKKKVKCAGRKHDDVIPVITAYNAMIRKDMSFIYDAPGRWYLKRTDHIDAIPLAEPIIIYAILHRLSELSRYDPARLEAHLGNQSTWLLTEFLNRVLDQLVMLIACEMTGFEIG